MADRTDMTGSHLNSPWDDTPLIVTRKPRMSVGAFLCWTAIVIGLVIWYLTS